MEMDDFVKMKMLEREGMTPYEQFKTQHMQAKSHTSGVAIAGLATGITGVVIGGTAWLFSGLFANAKAKEAKEAAQSAKELASTQYTAALQLMTTQNQSTNATLDRIARSLERETDARVSGDLNITNTINDTVSGSQQGTLSQSQQLSNDIALGLMTGKYSENPIKVVRVSGQRECGCDGCNG